MSFAQHKTGYDGKYGSRSSRIFNKLSSLHSTKDLLRAGFEDTKK
jgi:hypothetical protein